MAPCSSPPRGSPARPALSASSPWAPATTSPGRSRAAGARAGGGAGARRRGAGDRPREGWRDRWSRRHRDLAIGYAGVGFDGEVTRFANQVKYLRGPAVYPYAWIHTLATLPAAGDAHRARRGELRGRAMFVVAANLPRFGGGMQIAPDARIDDGLLDLVVVREVPGRVPRHLPKVYTGNARRPFPRSPSSAPGARRSHSTARIDDLRRRRAGSARWRRGRRWRSRSRPSAAGDRLGADLAASHPTRESRMSCRLMRLC